MKRRIFKIWLLAYIVLYNLIKLLSFKMSLSRFIYTLKRQVIVSSLFRDSKYSKVGGKYFLDPFAPSFPGRFFRKMLDNNSMDRYPLKPNHAQISITNLCPCHCFHCHVINTQDASKDLPRERIFEAIDDIVTSDFHVIFFVGGEPFSRFDDLLEFVRYARKNLDTRIFTSGIGATGSRLRLLKEAGLQGICVSLDHFDERIHNQQRNNNAAFESACFAIRESARLGIYTSAVCCTTSWMVESGDVFRVVDFAESLGAHSVQLNEIRPAGRAGGIKDRKVFLTQRDKEILIDYYRSQNRGKRRTAVVMPWYNEEPDRFGCMATSGQNAYIDALGNVQPCVLLKVSIGNILEERFSAIWNEFIRHCRHPVRECLVQTLHQAIDESCITPLPKTRTLELWQEVTQIEPTDIFKRTRMKQT